MPQLDFITFVTQYVWFTLFFGMFYFVGSFFFFPSILKIIKTRRLYLLDLVTVSDFYQYLLSLRGNLYYFFIYKLLVKSDYFQFKFNDTVLVSYIQILMRKFTAGNRLNGTKLLVKYFNYFILLD